MRRKQGKTLLILLITTTAGTTDREDCEEIIIGFLVLLIKLLLLHKKKMLHTRTGINALEELELSITAALYSSLLSLPNTDTRTGKYWYPPPPRTN